MPCEYLLVTLGGKNLRLRKGEDHYHGSAYFYFPQRVMLSREHHFYSFLSMVAEVGGYVGLILGVSLFHLVRWHLVLELCGR